MDQATKIADFSQPESAQTWRFFTDQVMGGVSTGAATVTQDALHLRGTVSTANRGGFIQARLDGVALPATTTALRLRLRGDGQAYFVHLRTRATRLPWQYYQARFETSGDWQEITLPLTRFTPSGALLPGTPGAETVRSVALVAYGRDHTADVRLSEVWALSGE